MELFKRVLLSLFPNEIVNQPVNPVSMFVSFISAKQYFFVINRKIVENYKLNMFEVSLDSFDVKIWFGEQPDIKMKNIDFYYSYGVSSNLNWYRFYSPSSVSNSLALISALYLKETFQKYNYSFFNSFILTVFLFSFIMISRIKVFPFEEEQKNYKWFIDLFFDFYRFVLGQWKVEVTNEEFNSLKNELLWNIQVFFMLYYTYKKLNKVFEDEWAQEKEFYNMMFYDELKWWPFNLFVSEFVLNYNEHRYNSHISMNDKHIFELIFPADVLIKLLFETDDIDLVISCILDQIFNKDKLDPYMSSFLKSDAKLEEFFHYIWDYKLFKEHYFSWLKKLSVYKFKNTNNMDIEEEMDELISAVGEGEWMDNIKIPDRIKKESALMERFINFYVMFIGSFWIARGDNFFVRLFRKDILDKLIDTSEMLEMKNDTLFFYGWLLYNYSKNIFYYKSAFDNVKAGKEKFNLPFMSNFKEIHSNSFLLKLFNENFINTILQDINDKDIKIYIKNKDILSSFRDLYFEKIKSMLDIWNEEIAKEIYWKVSYFLTKLNYFDSIISQNLSNQDILNIKESLYTYDFWIWMDLLEIMKSKNIQLSQTYSDYSILWIISIFRDTLLWAVLYFNYLISKQKEANKSLNIEILVKTYLYDVVWISDKYLWDFTSIIDSLIIKNDLMAQKWVSLDDNDSYFKLWYDNWNWFIEAKIQNSQLEISGEDVIWFRWYLKNITFYNKRFLIPKE